MMTFNSSATNHCTGCDYARCVEIKAHKDLIDDPIMDDFILPERSRQLCWHFLRCTLPLVESQQRGTESPRMRSQWLAEEARLTKIFRIALQIKTQLLISTDLYQCYLPTPGAPFED